MVERAIDFVLRWQRPDGSVRWSLDQAGRPEGYALLTGSSSIYHSLRCAVAVAEKLGEDRLAGGWAAFVMEGLGVRCVSTSDWVTAAETAECVLALDALGLDDLAVDLLVAGQALRLPDGTYWTGLVYPDDVSFPGGERTTYTAAAMVLAADALSRTSPASGLFRGEGLPAGLDLAEAWCDGAGAGCSARG